MKFFLAKSKEIQERTGLFNVFVPCWEEDEAVCNKLGRGEIIECKDMKQRDIVKHRKYFALMNLSIKNMPDNLRKQYPSVDVLRSAIMVEIGEVNIFYDFKGNKYQKPKSISFEKMDEIKFQEIYSKSFDCILQYIFPDITPEEFMNELKNFM